MPTPSIPLAKARLTGADKKDPQRYRDRVEPEVSQKPVGNPPGYMSKDAKAAWREAAGSLGWLVHEDRLALEVASLAIAAMRETAKAGLPVPAALVSAANTALGKLGANPTERGKVFQPAKQEEPDDPFAKFGAPH